MAGLETAPPYPDIFDSAVSLDDEVKYNVWSSVHVNGTFVFFFQYVTYKYYHTHYKSAYSNLMSNYVSMGLACCESSSLFKFRCLSLTPVYIIL